MTVAAGPFLFGSAAAGIDAVPERNVELETFAIDRYAVTAGDFACCLAAGECDERTMRAEASDGCTLGVAGKADHPVNCVTFSAAERYCGWLGRRLPTEQEWEKAARGADGRVFPWGNEPAAGRANCDDGVCGDAHRITAPVTAFAAHASPYGAVQMAGNVWQWVDSWYAGDHDGKAAIAVPAQTFRVVRGGSWREHDDALRASSRHYLQPGSTLHNVGFRCAR